MYKVVYQIGYQYGQRANCYPISVIRMSAKFHFSGHLLKIVETSNIYQPKLCTYMVIHVTLMNAKSIISMVTWYILC